MREMRLRGSCPEKRIKLIEKANPRREDLAEHLSQEMLFTGRSLKGTP